MDEAMLQSGPKVTKSGPDSQGAEGEEDYEETGYSGSAAIHSLSLGRVPGLQLKGSGGSGGGGGGGSGGDDSDGYSSSPRSAR